MRVEGGQFTFSLPLSVQNVTPKVICTTHDNGSIRSRARSTLNEPHGSYTG